MNINQLKYFLAIAKTGNFYNAADDMYISASSLSKQIKALETELSAQLFRRDHAKVVLTEAGERFLRYARESLSEYNELLSDMGNLYKHKAFTIKIGAIPVLSAYGIIDKIAAFISLYKDNQIIIDMYENDQYTAMKLLREDVIDIALVRVDKLRDKNHYDFIVHLQEKFVLVCRKDHPLAKKKVATLQDIAAYPLLMLEFKSSINNILASEFEKNQVNVTVKSMATRHKILLQMVATDNNSVSMLPENLVDKNIFPDLRAVTLKEPIISTVALCKYKNKKLSDITKQFWLYWEKNHSLSTATS
jgi:DNA-binding transcriptional LysR family regulator